MSLGDRRARLFIDSLAGKAAVFRLADRRSNLELARAVLPLLAAGGEGCLVLDLDALYSSNMGDVASVIPADRTKRIGLSIPEPGSTVEVAITDLLSSAPARPLIVDSANSLYQLLSMRNQRSASRKFAFFIAALSTWARVNGVPVLSSIYERETATRGRTARSLSEMFDAVISVVRGAEGLALTCERGNAWRDRAFFLPFQGGEVRAHED